MADRKRREMDAETRAYLADFRRRKAGKPTAQEAAIAAAQAEAAAWNEAHPVGTPVRFWSWVREGEGRASHTRSVAWAPGHTPMVLVEGYFGGILLSHVEVVA